MDADVQAYVDTIAPEHRALFERLHRIVLSTHPDAVVGLSYRMPAYRVGRHRLSVGVWQHGVSVYGWRGDNDGGFSARHPELLHSKRTIRIRTQDADVISDEEFSALLGGALEE